MKFGIHSGLWMARWTDDIAPVFATVADLGFDGVEVSLLGMTDERAAALRGPADDHGLEVTCSDGLSREADISSPDPEVRATGLDYLRWAVRTTVAIWSGRDNSRYRTHSVPWLRRTSDRLTHPSSTLAGIAGECPGGLTPPNG